MCQILCSIKNQKLIMDELLLSQRYIDSGEFWAIFCIYNLVDYSVTLQKMPSIQLMFVCENNNIPLLQYLVIVADNSMKSELHCLENTAIASVERKLF